MEYRLSTADGVSARGNRERVIAQTADQRVCTCTADEDVVARPSVEAVVDVTSGEVVTEGLSMPHSPRLYRGKLWLLNSGEGSFGWVDVATGQFTALTFCPGYARGLTFAGDFAIIGLSRPRENRTFTGLPLDAALKSHDAEARCGLLVVDLASGAATDWVRIEGVVDELFDVAYLPNTRCPSAIGLRGPEIARVLSVADPAFVAD